MDKSKPDVNKVARGFSGTQKYDEIISKSVGSNILFEDPEFPADSESLNISDLRDRVKGKVEWKRPKVYCYCCIILFVAS